MTTTRTLTVALVGNPNTGKSTLFNALTGLRQHVGNYPGVTVELKKGRTTFHDREIEIIDLPGTYSLAARSPDEMVTVDLLLGARPEQPRPDVIVSIVDATNLERHLYLTTQLMEIGVPVVLAINMIDMAETRGIAIDFVKLQERLGIPVVPLQANKGKGLDALRNAIAQASYSPTTPVPPEFPEAFQATLADLGTSFGGVAPFLLRRLLLDVGGYTQVRLTEQLGDGIGPRIVDARQRLAQAGCSVPAVEAQTRWRWIRARLAECIEQPRQRAVTLSDRLDRVFTHKLWGTLLFLALMFLVFEAIFVGASPLMQQIDAAKVWLAGQIEDAMDPGPLRALLIDGILKGVGGVLIFLPQIMILFAFIAVLEDCGYMARAAFLMDKIMSKCGLNGKSFIPLLSSVACAVPGIMATRVIENRRDRLATILVAPLMSCSARLPLYMLLIGVFLRDPWWLPGIALFGMYLLGIIVAPLVALTLKRTLLRGPTPLFVLEMPPFKRPQLSAVLRRMMGAGWAFIYRAGTLILASMILIWALLYFPTTIPDGEFAGQSYDQVTSQFNQVIKDKENAITQLKKEEGSEEKIEQLESEIEEHERTVSALYGSWKRQSYLGRAGQSLEPVFTPLGWDWKIGMAALASFPAREVIVGTMGIIYDEGEADPKEIREAEDVTKTPLGKAIQEKWTEDPVRGKYRVPIAVGLMVFFALCCQCVSTLAVIRRETQSWWWPVFTFTYMTTLAYLATLAVFQVGRAIIG